MSPEPPTGVVTLLFTDIEGSTRLWDDHPAAMRLALERHDVIARERIDEAGGHVFKTVGDAFCAVFVRARDAIEAAVTIQRDLAREPWTEPVVVRVRMGLHTGLCVERDGDYFGPTVNRVARLEAVAHGGQVVLSAATKAAIDQAAGPPTVVADLGEHRLKDLREPERIYQVLAEGLVPEFPDLRTVGRRVVGRLPSTSGTLVGRESDSSNLMDLVGDAAVVTVVGPGGVGKSRLTVEVARVLADGFDQGAWMCDLASLDRNSSVDTVVRSVAADLKLTAPDAGASIDRLCVALEHDLRLLVFDNCEHVVAAAADVAAALGERCRGVKILASSRMPLAIDREVVYPLAPLAVPETAEAPLEIALSSPSVALFVAVARRSSPSFALDRSTAAPVSEVCRRLDGLPLAIELAAARVRVLPVAEMARRMDDRFAVLESTRGDRGQRARTLRSSIEWSYELLGDEQRKALRLLAAFEGPFDLESAEQILRGALKIGPPLDALLDLVDQSLVMATTDGYRLLETIAEFARELPTPATERDERVARLIDWAESVLPESYYQLDHQQQGRVAFHYATLRVVLRGDPGSTSHLGAVAVRMVGYWMQSNRARDGIEVLDPLLEGLDDYEVEAELCTGMAALCGATGRYEDAGSWNDRAESLAQRSGMQEVLIRVLYNRAVDLFIQGDLVRAEASAKRLLESLDQLPDTDGWQSVGRTLAAAVVMHLGRYDKARAILDTQTLQMGGMDDRYNRGAAQFVRAELALAEGRFADADAAVESMDGFDEAMTFDIGAVRILAHTAQGHLEAASSVAAALSFDVETGFGETMARARSAVGSLLLARGDSAGAAQEFCAALRITRGRYGINHADNLEGLAVALDRTGAHDEAATLAHRAAALRTDTGAARSAVYSHLIGAELEDLRAVPHGFNVASVDEAIELGLKASPTPLSDRSQL